MHLDRLELPLSSFPWSVTRTPPTQQQTYSAEALEDLFMGKPGLSFPLIRTTWPLRSSPRASAVTSVALNFSKKVPSVCSSLTLVSFWQTVAGMYAFSFILTRPAAWEALWKRASTVLKFQMKEWKCRMLSSDRHHTSVNTYRCAHSHAGTHEDMNMQHICTGTKHGAN